MPELAMPVAMSSRGRKNDVEAALAWQNAAFPIPVTSQGPCVGDWLAVANLVSDHRSYLGELLAGQEGLPPDADPRTRAAFLLHRYGYYFSIAIAGLYLHAGHCPDLRTDRVGIAFEDGEIGYAGQTYHVHKLLLRLAGAITPVDDVSTLRREIEGHFAPLVACLGEMTRFSSGALWRIVGDAVALAFLEVGKQLGAPDRAKTEALAVLKHPGSPLNNPQFHFLDVSSETPDGRRMTRTFCARGGCCRYYRVDGGEMCANCVLEQPDRREERLREFMLRSAEQE